MQTPVHVHLSVKEKAIDQQLKNLVARDDKMIPQSAQWQMSKRAGSTAVEVPGSHAIHVSNPAPWRC
jgi:hypothetical protein